MVISLLLSESGVCLHISDKDRVWYVYDVLYAAVYVRVSCFVMRGCAVSRRYIDGCNIVMCLVLLMCTLTICGVCINGRRYVCCSECNVVSNECDEPSIQMDD